VTREDAQLLLDELDALDIRCAAVALRRPGDADVDQLRRDIAVRHALVVSTLAWLRLTDTLDAFIH
jgi:hypothetical protein